MDAARKNQLSEDELSALPWSSLVAEFSATQRAINKARGDRARASAGRYGKRLAVAMEAHPGNPSRQ